MGPDREIIPYIVPTISPIKRGESALVYGIEKDKMKCLVEWILYLTEKPNFRFDELLNAHAEGNLDRLLSDYMGKTIIVRDAYDLADSADSPLDVYWNMRSIENRYDTHFIMFDDCDGSGLEARTHDPNHAMFNWNSFVDLSECE